MWLAAWKGPDLITVAEDVEGSQVEVLRGPGWEQIGFQLGPGAVETNPESVIDRLAIRQAILAALDRQSIAEAVHGSYGEALDSIVGLGWPGKDQSIWDDSGEAAGRLGRGDPGPRHHRGR